MFSSSFLGYTTTKETTTVTVTTPTTTEQTTSTTSQVSTTKGHCLEKMDSEVGVKSKDKTFGKLIRAIDTGFLTFSELPIGQAVGNSAILEREYTSNINVRGLLVTLVKTAQSVTSGQAEGMTTPNTGSTSPQSVKITFTLYTKKGDETDFKQVIIDNTTSEFTLANEANPSEVKVFSIVEPLLKGIKKLQVKFTDVVGVSGATIELTVLGCAEGNHFLLPRQERFFLITTQYETIWFVYGGWSAFYDFG